MLEVIIEISKYKNVKIENGTLFCRDYIVDDIQKLAFLEDDGLVEDSLGSVKKGNAISLELTLAKLHKYGFYENYDAFVSKNQYRLPIGNYYIHEISNRGNSQSEFTTNHSHIVGLINAIESVSKHTYQDADIKSSILFREDKTAYLPFIYSTIDVNSIKNIKSLESISSFLGEESSEKKLLIINELIETINSQQESQSFAYLLSQIDNFYERCENAYQYYLRDFSYNKLKVELDSKALEFAQKIQAVINDSQAKLIAIPTAFVLVIATFDFEKILSSKNVGAVIGLFVFSILIQLFINNQRSALKFIKQNIDAYKGTFKNNEIDQTSNSFILVEVEFNKQDFRLKTIEVILWSIPVGMVCFSIYLLYNFQSIVFIYLAIVITHAFLRVKWDNK